MEPAGRQMIVPESAGAIRGVDAATFPGYNEIVAAYSVLLVGDCLYGSSATKHRSVGALMFAPKEGWQWQAF